MMKNHRDDLLYPELSYKIIGCSFDVYNDLGAGHAEQYYERALAEAFSGKQIKFARQVYYPLKYKEKIIGKNFLDFLVEDKIIVEIKKGDRYSKRHIDQVLAYLRVTETKLAILINFGQDGVTFKRIINLNS
jgi:GxxExxY protein